MMDVDPLEDLNAMHEAEFHLTDDQVDEYTGWLCELTRRRRGGLLYFATAKQRAEAFLRTVGEWGKA